VALPLEVVLLAWMRPREQNQMDLHSLVERQQALEVLVVPAWAASLAYMELEPEQ
jgi:hypothetical protein